MPSITFHTTVLHILKGSLDYLATVSTADHVELSMTVYDNYGWFDYDEKRERNLLQDTILASS